MFFFSLSTLFIVILVVTAFYDAVLEFCWFRTLQTVPLGKLIREPLPSVSILVATHNEKGPIQKNINNILRQECQDPRNIWINDGLSTDETPPNFAQYVAQYPNKFHITTPKDPSKSPSLSKNAISPMITTCESEILLLTDADLHLRAAHDPWKTRCGVNTKTPVKTSRKKTLKELWEQRKRWASQTIYNSSSIIFLLSIGFFLALYIVGSLPLFSYKIVMATLFVFAVKVIGDLFLTVFELHIFNQQQLLKWFLPVEFFHAPFMVLSVPFGTAGKFQWKP